MNVIVCMKQVPDTTTKIKIADDHRTIDETDVTFVVNPYDEYAVEEGLQIKERTGGKLTVISMGPDRVAAALRSCLAMGADEAIHVKDDSLENSDSLGIARALAAAVKNHPFDLILVGKHAVGTDNAQVGPMLAHFLDIPHVSVVTKLEVQDGQAVVQREIEGAKEIVETPLPAVITAQKGLNEPRYASLKGIMAAKKKQIPETSCADLELDVSTVGEAAAKTKRVKLELPPVRPGGRIVDGEPAEAVAELVRLLHSEEKLI